MSTTAQWTLILMLAHGLRVDLGPQADCVGVAQEWMHAARAWELRSGVEPAAMWACIPPDVAYRLERVSR